MAKLSTSSLTESELIWFLKLNDRIWLGHVWQKDQRLLTDRSVRAQTLFSS